MKSLTLGQVLERPEIREFAPRPSLLWVDIQGFESVVSGIWTDYWLERRERFVRYPMSVFGRDRDELGNDGYDENVIFTKGNPPHAGRRTGPRA